MYFGCFFALTELYKKKNNKGNKSKQRKKKTLFMYTCFFVFTLCKTALAPVNSGAPQRMRSHRLIEI